MDVSLCGSEHHNRSDCLSGLGKNICWIGRYLRNAEPEELRNTGVVHDARAEELRLSLVKREEIISALHADIQSISFSLSKAPPPPPTQRPANNVSSSRQVPAGSPAQLLHNGGATKRPTSMTSSTMPSTHIPADVAAQGSFSASASRSPTPPPPPPTNPPSPEAPAFAPDDMVDGMASSSVPEVLNVTFDGPHRSPGPSTPISWPHHSLTVGQKQPALKAFNTFSMEDRDGPDSPDSSTRSQSPSIGSSLSPPLSPAPSAVMSHNPPLSRDVVGRDVGQGDRARTTNKKSRSASGVDTEFPVPSMSPRPQPSVGAVIDKKKLNALLKVWRILWNHRHASWFRHPVMEDEAPDYFQVIKRPMDLSTIKQRLMDGTITNSQEFYDHVMLMLTNAFTYNDKDSPVYQYAEVMKQVAEKEMDTVRQNEQILSIEHVSTRRRR